MERLTMKDWRAAVGSHAESLAETRRRLLHSSEGVIDKHYRRAPARIVPILFDRFLLDRAERIGQPTTNRPAGSVDEP